MATKTRFSDQVSRAHTFLATVTTAPGWETFNNDASLKAWRGAFNELETSLQLQPFFQEFMILDKPACAKKYGQKEFPHKCQEFTSMMNENISKLSKDEVKDKFEIRSSPGGREAEVRRCAGIGSTTRRKDQLRTSPMWSGASKRRGLEQRGGKKESRREPGGT